jgi:hypothetical protein
MRLTAGAFFKAKGFPLAGKTGFLSFRVNGYL